MQRHVMQCQADLGWRIRVVAAAALSLPLVVLAAPFAYVPSSRAPSLSVIDTATNVVVADISLEAPATGVAVDRAGQRVYVAGGGRLTIVDAATRTVAAMVPIESAHGVAVNPAGTRAYVTRELGGGLSRPVAVVDTATAAVVGAISTGSSNLYTAGIVFDAVRRTLFVAAFDGISGTDALIVDARTNTIVGNVSTIAMHAYGIALNHDGSKLYVACWGLGNPRDHYRDVLVIDAASGRYLGSLSTTEDPISGGGVTPYAVATDATGRRVYVATSDGLRAFDATTHAMVARMPGGDLRGVAVHPDGTRVYAANYRGASVNVYDAVSLTLVDVVPVGPAPVALGMFIGPMPAASAAVPIEVPATGPIVLIAMAGVVALLGASALCRSPSR